MLQLMVQRLRMTNFRFQLRNQPPAVKLAYSLISLADAYGQAGEAGTEILNIPTKDMADVTDISEDEANKIFEKLTEKGWIKIDDERDVIVLTNVKQLTQLAGRA
jgi:CRP/FNR family cyclic AMP-dependent transcriptional regulator